MRAPRVSRMFRVHPQKVSPRAQLVNDLSSSARKLDDSGEVVVAAGCASGAAVAGTAAGGRGCVVRGAVAGGCAGLAGWLVACPAAGPVAGV